VIANSTLKSLARLRVDFVGSFLRPESLKGAYAEFESGKIDRATLSAYQDDAIRQLIASEDAHGMPIIGDGEFRRRNFQQSFQGVAGFDLGKSWTAGQRTGADQELGLKPVAVARQPATEPLRLVRNNLLEEYSFAAGCSQSPVKVTLIGPDRIVQSYNADASRDVYGDLDAFADAVVCVQRQMIDELRVAGCRYVQIDAPSYTAYVDARSMTDMRERGEDPVHNMQRAMRRDNALVEAFPEVTFGIHLCRGNRRSKSHREGSYEAIAEQLFGTLKHDRFLLEYDNDRAGTFEPLRFVPKGKMVVLGLITTKTGDLENIDELQRRIEEASRFIPLDQLALSPQCGFASELEGNLLSEDDQWRKLDIMLETASRVWGSTGTAS
jgi:5-methyltetrahydropteroyltriglutamate--homocysteine methyltransferase